MSKSNKYGSEPSWRRIENFHPANCLAQLLLVRGQLSCRPARFSNARCCRKNEKIVPADFSNVQPSKRGFLGAGLRSIGAPRRSSSRRAPDPPPPKGPTMSDKESKPYDKCPACRGTGAITVVQFVKRRSPNSQSPRCPKCGGTGRIPKAKS